MSDLSHNIRNDNRMDDYMKSVREFGRNEAEGHDALPKLALAVVEAVDQGVIDADMRFGGDQDKDVFTYSYEEYVKASSKKSVHEHTANGKRANASKLRQLGRAAINPKCDFKGDVLPRAIKARQDMEKANQKVVAAFPSFVAVARAQNQSDDPLTDEQIAACVRKPDPKEKTVEDELKRASDILDKLITGDNKHGLTDQSEHTIAAYENIQQRLTALMQSRRMDELRAEAEELGVSINDNTETQAEAA